MEGETMTAKTKRTKRYETIEAAREREYMEDRKKKVVTWACLTARNFGFTWNVDPNDGVIEVLRDGERVQWCGDFDDFVSFISDENQKRVATK